MTLKYTPIYKRIQFAQNGDKIQELEQQAERVGNYLGYNQAQKDELLTRSLNPSGRYGSWRMTNGQIVTGNAFRRNGNTYIQQNDGSTAQVDDSNHVLFPLQYSSAFRGNDARAILDWVPVVGDVLQGQDAFDAARTGDYLTAGTTAALMFLPGAVGKRLSPYINKGMRRVLNNLDPDSWLSRRLFGNNPNAVRRLRGESYVENLGDGYVRRNSDGIVTSDLNGDIRPDIVGKVNEDGWFIGRDGRVHYVDDDPYRRVPEGYVAYVEPKEAKSLSPKVEQRSQNVAGQSRDPFARERDILNRASEEKAARYEQAGKQVPEQAAATKPVEAQIDEEKAAAAREVAEKARQEAYRKASRQYAALSDDEVMSSYREMAKSGKVDTPEYEAILQEGQTRNMLDANGRPISKGGGQKPASSSMDEPSAATKKTKKTKAPEKSLKEQFSESGRNVWRGTKWILGKSPYVLVAGGVGAGSYSALKPDPTPADSLIKTQSKQIMELNKLNKAKQNQQRIDSLTKSLGLPGSTGTTERRDTAVAGDVKPDEQPVQVQKHQSFKDIMDQF